MIEPTTTAVTESNAVEIEEIRTKRKRRCANELVRPFTCQTCERSYTCTSSLNKHVRLKHSSVSNSSINRMLLPRLSINQTQFVGNSNPMSMYASMMPMPAFAAMADNAYYTMPYPTAYYGNEQQQQHGNPRAPDFSFGVPVHIDSSDNSSIGSQSPQLVADSAAAKTPECSDDGEAAPPLEPSFEPVNTHVTHTMSTAPEVAAVDSKCLLSALPPCAEGALQEAEAFSDEYIFSDDGSQVDLIT